MTGKGDFDREWDARQARIDRNLRIATRCITLAGVCVVLIIVINVGHLVGAW